MTTKWVGRNHRRSFDIQCRPRIVPGEPRPSDPGRSQVAARAECIRPTRWRVEDRAGDRVGAGDVVKLDGGGLGKRLSHSAKHPPLNSFNVSPFIASASSVKAKCEIGLRISTTRGIR